MQARPIMQARMKNPVLILPDALRALLDLKRAADQGGLPARTAALAHLRASQINGCSVCVDAAFHELMQAGESGQRAFAVSAWRDMPWFSEGERAALALSEAVTRLSQLPEGVPDAVWDEAARHHDERALAALVLQIALQNVWNRLNTAVRQVAGAAWG